MRVPGKRSFLFFATFVFALGCGLLLASCETGGGDDDTVDVGDPNVTGGCYWTCLSSGGVSSCGEVSSPSMDECDCEDRAIDSCGDNGLSVDQYAVGSEQPSWYESSPCGE